VTRLNEKDYFYLKFVPVFELRQDVKLDLKISLCFRRLIELLRSSQDPIVLAVAAHDLGQYVKYYERGKKYVFFELISYPLVPSNSLPPLPPYNQDCHRPRRENSRYGAHDT
jgi:hypothetical protein